MRCRWVLTVVSAAFVCLTLAANAFTLGSRPPKQCNRQGRLPMHNGGDVASKDEDDAHDNIIRSSRREFLSKVAGATAAAAPILLAASSRASAAAATDNEPTRIELTVDTEYLIRVLEYFDGDMRKVLGVLVRSPQTTVEIDPPPKARRVYRIPRMPYCGLCTRTNLRTNISPRPVGSRWMSQTRGGSSS